MKYKFDLFLRRFLLILSFILMMSLNNVVFAEESLQLDDGKLLSNPPYGFAQDPLNAVYSNSGSLVSGPNILDSIEKDGKQLIPITYQGEKSRYITPSISKKIYDKVALEGSNNSSKGPLTSSSSFSVNLKKGDFFYFTDFGEYNGASLRLKIYSNYDAVIIITTYDATISVNSKGSPYGLSDFYYVLEDTEGNIVNDPDYLLLVGGIFGVQDRYVWHADGSSNPTYISYANYIFANNTVSNMLTNQTDANYLRTATLNVDNSTIKKISEPVRSYIFYPENGAGALGNSKFASYIQQSGEPTHVVRNLYSSDGRRLAKEPYLDYIGAGAYFNLFGVNTLPVRVPYGFPIIRNTINNETDDKNKFKIKLDVTQTLPAQSKKEFYPNLLQITVDLTDKAGLIDQAKLDPTQFKLTLDGTDITSKAKITLSQTEPRKLSIDLNRENLNSIGGAVVHIEGLLDVKHEDESLYESIDSNGYIFINGLRAENNINKKDYTSGDLKAKAPGPQADPIPIAVLEGSSTDDLVASNLVKNMETLLPNDTVIIEGFNEKTVFETAGETIVEVILRSERVPKATTTIPVPVTVLAKTSPQLPDLTIVTEKDKTANTKAELTYNPSYIQNLKSITDSTDLFNHVHINFKYEEGLKVTETDFMLTDEKGNKIDTSLYDLELNQATREVNISISKNSLANELKNREINIQQHSKIDTADKKIMTLYDKNSKAFNFNISGYNSWNLKENAPYIFSKVSSDNQKISYEPKIEAVPVSDIVVDVGSEVKEPKDYIKSISEPDFEFDTYQMNFKEKPNFSTPGKKEFIVTVSSDSFGTTLDVPVTVLVVDPSINLTINYYQWINDGMSKKEVIDNLVDGTRKKQLIESVVTGDKSIATLLADNKKLQAPDIEGYNFNSKDTTKTVVTLNSQPDKVIPLSEKLPTEDFTINYYYEPTIQINVPTVINFGVREKKEETNVYGMVPSKEEMNNYISIIDTYETTSEKPYWTLYASTDGFYNDTTGVRLLADILIKIPEFTDPKEITNESTPLIINNTDFIKNISLVDKQQEDGLFVKVGKVRELGKYNGVLKYKLQAAP